MKETLRPRNPSRVPFDIEIVTRRNFLQRAGSAVLGLGLAGVWGCSRSFPVRPPGVGGSAHPPAGDWDPVFGPPLQGFSRYGGPGDFQGHLRGRAAPGVDYDVPSGTPLVPSMLSYLIQMREDRNGSRFVLMSSAFHPPFEVSYGHLEKILVDERYRVSGDIKKFLGNRIRLLGRGEIIALSGNSGLGPMEYGGVQPPHLHLSAFWDEGNNLYEDLNPEAYGPDGGRPVYWDGRTPLDGEADKRFILLEETLRNFEEELSGWETSPEIEEVKGSLLESYRSMDHSRPENIQDSEHFQGLKNYLQRIILKEKRFIPGTGPYSLMLKILSYSTNPKQKVILTLPFIAPGLEKIYRRAVYEEGRFLPLVPP